MDIQAYLTTQRDRLRRQSRGVKDYRVFDFAYVPDEPMIRPEAKPVIDALLRFDLTGVPSNLLVLGSRGSGKTLTLKHLCGLLPEQTSLQMHYVKVTDQLDAATRSSLQLTSMLFRNYTPVQIGSILLARAEQGLKSWDEAALSQIAARTVRLTHADARVAIKTLFYLTPGMGVDGIGSKHKNSRSSDVMGYPVSPPLDTATRVELAFESARRDIVLDMINDLNDALLLILRAVVNGTSRLAKDTYQRYCRFSKEASEPPFSYVHYYASLAYLQSCGLVALTATKLGRAYTNRVEPTFDGQVVEPIVKLRFG